MSEKLDRTPEAQPSLQLTEETARTVLDSLSAHIAILDEAGVILETNRAWRQYAARGGMPEDYHATPVNYLHVCDASKGPGAEDALKVAEGIRAVIAGRLVEFLYDYPCHTPTSRHWYYLRAIGVADEGPARTVVSHEEVTALKLTEEALRKSREELQEQKQSLEEANIALKVLLKQREEDRVELEQKVLANVKELVFPYVDKLKGARLKATEKTLVEIIDAHLNDIISPLLQRLANVNIILTPQEMQVAALVKDGKSSKEIADILNIAETTVHFHRKNLRAKFNLKDRRVNLRTFLLSMS
jgi:DNA-binding CsgD family transcriptional regulator